MICQNTLQLLEAEILSEKKSRLSNLNDLTKMVHCSGIDLLLRTLRGNWRKNKLQKAPQRRKQRAGNIKTLTEPKKPLETLTEGLEGIHKLQRQADAKKQDIDCSLAICREYQQNIKTSSQLQTEILKGAKAKRGGTARA